MIFITVGTHESGFERLVKAGDELAARLNEKIIIQTGNTSYQPIRAEYFKWGTGKQIEALMQEARVVISHAGAGTIIQAIKLGKPLVIVPRQATQKEVHFDHQHELADTLHRQGRAIVVYEPSIEALQQAIDRASNLACSAQPPVNRLVKALRAQLETWATEEKR